MPVSVIQRNFGLVVAGLALALLAGACDGADVPNPPPLTAGPGSNTLFTADDVGEESGEVVDLPQEICNKLLSCYPQKPPPGTVNVLMEQCLRQVAAFALYIIDASAFVACFTALPCYRLFSENEDDIEEAVGGCAALDEDSAKCVSQTTFEFCSLHGTCKQVECEILCATLGGVGDTCVENRCRCIFDQPQYGGGD